MAGFGSGHPGGKQSAGVGLFKHGAYHFLRTGNTNGCKKCAIGKVGQCNKYDENSERCDLALEAQDLLIEKIRALPWITPTDMPTVELYIRNYLFCFIVDKWLSLAGSMHIDNDEGVVGAGILKQRWVAENAMLRAATALGLTPESRKNLGLPLSEESELVKISSEAEERFRSKPVESVTELGNGKDR
ncbi:MAG TPA: hypothetical protein DCS07_02225 [Bdellovibrionales bacterium]|nr:hypothetical protein [Bdellovibrionales bacterium]